MLFNLTQSIGSHRKGSTINVSKATAQLLARAGKGTIAEESAKPKATPKAAAAKATPAPAEAPPVEATAAPVEAPPADEFSSGDVPQEDLKGMLKADLATLAYNEGIKLDGSETKADLITRIERHRRRYARRDMQAD